MQAAGELKQVSNINWERALKALLGKDLSFKNIIATDDQLVITTDSKDAKLFTDRYQQVLKNASALKSSLTYAVDSADQKYPLPDSKAANLLFPENNVKSGKQIFKNVFENAIKEVGMDFDSVFPADTAISKNHVLYSRPADAEHIIDVWQSYFKAFNLYLKHVTSERLCQAMLNRSQGGEPLPKPIGLPKTVRQSKLTGIGGKLFGITEDQQIYFNYGLLCRLVIQPLLAKKDSADSTEIKIDKHHLMAYVAQLVGNGVFFEVEKMAEKDQLTPIFLNPRSGVMLPHWIDLVIDCSGSMDKYISHVKAQIKQLIMKLKPFNPTIRLVTFSDFIGPTREFKSIKDDASCSALNGEITNILADGRTRLFDTLYQELSHIREEKITITHNATMIVFSDGEDTLSKKRIEDIKQAIYAFEQQEAPPKPQVFTMLAGEGNEAILRELSSAMGTPYIHLDSPTGFSEIEKHLNEITCESEIVKIQQVLDEQIKTANLRIYQNGSPYIADFKVDLHPGKATELTINDDKMRLMTQTPKAANSPAPVADAKPAMSDQASAVALINRNSAGFLSGQPQPAKAPKEKARCSLERVIGLASQCTVS